MSNNQNKLFRSVQCLLLLSCCICISTVHSQTSYKLAVGLHSSDIPSLKGISEGAAFDNKLVNYHATLGYVFDLSLLFAEASVGVDVDRYRLDQQDLSSVRLIAPVQVGIKLLMFDIHTGLMARYTLTTDEFLETYEDITGLSLQYRSGIGFRFKNIGLTLDYASAKPHVINSIFDQEINADTSIRDRVFLSAFVKFGGSDNKE